MAPHFERVGGDVESGNARSPGAGGHKASEDAHRSGLPGAVWAKKTKNFAFVDGERDVIHRGDRPVGLGQILNLDQYLPPYEQYEKRGQKKATQTVLRSLLYQKTDQN
jgi:hypothetical protein